MIENFPVGVEYFVRRQTFVGWRIPTRTIENHELVFVLSGQGVVTIEGRSYDLRAGHVLYLYPGLTHALSVSECPEMEFYGIHFSLPAEIPRLPFGKIQFFANLSPVKTTLHGMNELSKKQTAFFQWRQNIAFEQVLCDLFCMQQAAKLPSMRYLQKVFDYITQNVTRNITLQELLSLVPVKKTLFCSAFRQATGYAPMQYVTLQRMEYARALLLQSTDSATQIAAHCGYDDVFYFSRCFKKCFGISPANLRKQGWL